MITPSALEDLYDEHAQAVFGYLLNLTRDMDETRDILQDLFVRLARRSENLDNIKDHRAFLLRMAHHIWVDLIRRRETGRRVTDEVHRDKPIQFEESASTDERLLSDMIDSSVAELPAEQRAVIHLKLREYRTFEQIAQILEIPANTAASRYRYGLDKIRELLRPLYQEIKD